MWSCSTGDMLSQNRRAWLKWSSNDADSSRTLLPAATACGTSRKALLGVTGDEGAPAVERVGPVGGHTRVHGGLVHAVAQHVVDRRVRAVDGQLVEVRPAQPGELGVDVREQPHLEQRVVGDVDAGHQVAHVEGDLLGLGEEVRRRARQGEQAERLHRGELLGDELGRVEQVDPLEGLVLGVLEGLHPELPLRVGADSMAS